MAMRGCTHVSREGGGPSGSEDLHPANNFTTASTTEQLPFFRLPASLYPAYSRLVKQASLMGPFAETMVGFHDLLKDAELVSGRAWACPRFLPFHCFAIGESSVAWLALGQAQTSAF